jgi:hypothetical protein
VHGVARSELPPLSGLRTQMLAGTRLLPPLRRHMPFGKGAAHDQSVRFSDTLVSWRMLTATPMRSSRPRCAAPRCAAPAPPEGQCARRCTKRLATPVRFADTTVHPGVQLPHPRRGKCTALHEATCHPCPVCGHNRSPWCAAPAPPEGQCARRCTKRLATPVRFADTSVCRRPPARRLTSTTRSIDEPSSRQRPPCA